MATRELEEVKARYRMALTRLQTSENKAEHYQQEAERISRESVMDRKMARDLCEKILKRQTEKRGENPREELTWSAMTLSEIIALAQNTLETRYAADEKEMQRYRKIASVIHRVQENSEERRAKNLELEEELRAAREKIKVLEETKPTTSPVKEDAANTQGGEQSGEDPIIDRKNENAFQPSKKLDVDLGDNADWQDTSEDNKTKDEVTAEIIELAAAMAGKLKKAPKEVLLEFGRTGRNDATSLTEEYIKSHKEAPSNFFKQGIQQLKGTNPPLIESIKLNTAVKTNSYCTRLTRMGECVYKALEGRDVVTPLYKKLEREHTTLDHGYSIKYIAEAFEAENCFAGDYIEHFTRSKDSRGKRKIDHNKSYIPDIYVEHKLAGGGKKELFFEYETTECSPVNFVDKCLKMGCITSNMFFIVSNDAGKKNLIKKKDALKAELDELRKKNQYPYTKEVLLYVWTWNEFKQVMNVKAGKDILQNLTAAGSCFSFSVPKKAK